MPPTPKDLSRDYTNAAFIAGADGYPPKWAQAAAAFRAGLGARARARDLAYGPADRQRLDLFLPDAAPRGLMVYLHGGYWLAFGRQDWSHLAAGALARGWAVAIPSYSLAPQARIAQITNEVAQAVATAAGMVPGPVVVTGHSAGGHLAARMGNLGGVAAVATFQVHGNRQRGAGANPANEVTQLGEGQLLTIGVAQHAGYGGAGGAHGREALRLADGRAAGRLRRPRSRGDGCGLGVLLGR